MHLTPYPDVNHLLDTLLSRIHLTLGDKLVGLYLYGSLVTGDFDHDISDIDLLAVTSSDLTPDELARLHRMHDQIATEYKQWDNRIEVAYLLSTGVTEETITHIRNHLISHR